LPASSPRGSTALGDVERFATPSLEIDNSTMDLEEERKADVEGDVEVGVEGEGEVE